MDLNISVGLNEFLYEKVAKINIMKIRFPAGLLYSFAFDLTVVSNKLVTHTVSVPLASVTPKDF